ncbi:FtsX-like permease family protein [Kitasatospora camelliae]|uniref:FtsX-like permease family protein n=1 Tax=Kitasatospora camelliae TaxID=3156397 RepID=A0AAU8K1Y6_9ACTN
MKLTAWRATLRIARRDVLRAKGRSALVLAMIALPVLGVAGADVVYRSAELEPQERITRYLGGADALVNSYTRGMTVFQEASGTERTSVRYRPDNAQPTAAERRSAETEPEQLARELLPAGSVLLPVGPSQRAAATTVAGQLGVEVTEADLTDPVWHGTLNVVEGTAPGNPRQIAATRKFLDDSGLRLGSTTTLRGLPGDLTITAVVEHPNDLRSTELIGRPGTLIEPLRQAAGQPQTTGRFDGGRWLVKLPAGATLDWPKVMEFNTYGFTVSSRSVMLDPPDRSQVPYYREVERDGYSQGGGRIDEVALVVVGTVVGMALLEIVLLAGPAFAVGARRSRRQLGLLAAGGGDRSHVRAVVLGGGVVLGLAGAVTGVVLASGMVAALRPWAEEAAGRRFGHLDLQPVDLLAIASLGLITGLLAAVVPAVQASRTDVVEALTGRGSVKPPSRLIALLGLLMVAGGALLAMAGAALNIASSLSVLGGSVIAEVGMVLLTPTLVGLFGRLGRWLPLGPRLALRDSVRHRGRTAPAVAAVMAAVAGAVAVGVYTTSEDADMRRQYTASLPAGAVQVNTAWGPTADPAQLPALRAAVEQAMPDLGPRADIATVSYQGDCRTGKSVCGSVEVSIPPERRCPVMDQDRPEPTDPGVYERTMREDPRCTAERMSSSISSFNSLPVGDLKGLHNLLGVRDQAVEAAFAQGKAVVFDPIYLKDGRITVRLTEPPHENEMKAAMVGGPQKRAFHEVGVEAVLAHSDSPNAEAYLGPDTARKLGLTVTDGGSVWLPERLPSSAAEQRATAAVTKLTDGADLKVERGYRSQQDLMTIGLIGFSALVALGAAGIATGLAAADSQHDLATLAAVGASGGIRRRLSGFQCGTIAGMGVLLGTVCGIVPAVALRKFEHAATMGYASVPGGEVAEAPIVFPWLQMGLTMVVLPLLAVLLAMGLTRSKLGLVRRQA